MEQSRTSLCPLPREKAKKAWDGRERQRTQVDKPEANVGMEGTQSRENSEITWEQCFKLWSPQQQHVHPRVQPRPEWEPSDLRLNKP